jgi:hypothetical protein
MASVRGRDVDDRLGHLAEGGIAAFDQRKSSGSLSERVSRPIQM